MIRIFRFLLAFFLLLYMTHTACINRVYLEKSADIGPKCQEYLQGLDSALADYFFRMGILRYMPEDLNVSVDWDWYEELYSRSLPKHSLQDELRWSDELDIAQVLAQVISAIDQEEFVYTYKDQLSRPEKFLASAKVIGFDLADSNCHVPTLRSVLSILHSARIDLGYYTPYSGHIEDKNIYRIAREKSLFIDKYSFPPKAACLAALGLQGIIEGIFTGYNIKDHYAAPLFSEKHTIRYAHDDTGHLLQMISLLRRENFDVRVAVEGHISSYVHHIDKWGMPDPSYISAAIDENRVLVSHNSFDILIEFPIIREMERFKDIVNKYATRKGQNTLGLIRASYYAPLYASSIPLSGYEAVMDLRVNKDSYYLQSYVLMDQFPGVLSVITEYASGSLEEMSIEYDIIYVNPEFITYMRNNRAY